ncbi:MAG: adenylosuccinate lyase [Candidatus Hodarchaeota archaeon]
MTIHPIETRYRSEEMNEIFKEEARLESLLLVEAALARAHAEVGNIPPDAAKDITLKASLKYVKLERVKAIDREIHHDTMAMVRALSEVCNEESAKFVHLGATSYDIVDTAWALQLKRAINILQKRLIHLLKVLLGHANEQKHTVCIGRTHGQHALPLTYGMKFALWSTEIARHLDRLKETRRRILVGKMSGAIGTMAGFGEHAIEIQNLIMKDLELELTLITNQIIQRDRHAEMMGLLVLIGGTLSKITKEIRNLQRTEINEIFEPFVSKTQVGSSTMAAKRNPWRSERVSGLYRVLKGNLDPALENHALCEHERDLSNSSVERIIFPEAFILLDFMLNQTIHILSGLEFNNEQIEANLFLTDGQILAERIMIELVKKGVDRQRAHELLRQDSIRARAEKSSYKQSILADKEFTQYCSEEELDAWLTPHTYIGKSVGIVEKVIEKLKADFSL